MNTKKQILNGPYLLGLTASHVTLAWEAAEEGSFSVVYGRGQAKQEKIVPSFQRELPCREYPTAAACIRQTYRPWMQALFMNMLFVKDRIC